MTTAPMPTRSPTTAGANQTAFLVMDSESVPDGDLIAAVKYAGENLSAEAAIDRAQAEARERAWKNSDFLPVSFHMPVAVCVLRVAADFTLQTITSLDSPEFRPAEIVRKFWHGVAHYPRARLVTFNGRGFDLPLLELAALRHGCSAPTYCQNSRNRYSGPIDLMDWVTNFGAYRLNGGLNLLAKLIGKPGKMEISGEQVFQMHRERKLQEISDYCLCDTLDTYFVFLRTRVFTGDLPTKQEEEVVGKARQFLESKREEFPALNRYLAEWGRLAGAAAANDSSHQP